MEGLELACFEIISSVETCLLLIHAEDQMMSAETFQVLAGEFIDLCKMINK